MCFGVCYYLEYWLELMWVDDVCWMKMFGIEQVWIVEFVWSCIELLLGEYDWGWFDCVVDVFGVVGFEIVMCMLIVMLLKWLVDCYFDIFVIGVDGWLCVFGLCCYYDFLLLIYFEVLCQICMVVVECYGCYLVVCYWQIDNEFGCYQIVVSYLLVVFVCFCEWLKVCYGMIDVLNCVWGIVFWSMEYCYFDEVDVLVGIVIEVYLLYCFDY